MKSDLQKYVLIFSIVLLCATSFMLGNFAPPIFPRETPGAHLVISGPGEFRAYPTMTIAVDDHALAWMQITPEAKYSLYAAWIYAGGGLCRFTPKSSSFQPQTVPSPLKYENIKETSHYG